MTPVALILAGGRSSRMGRDKATLPWAGRTVIEELAARLQPAFAEVIVSSNFDRPLPRTAGYELWDVRPGEGPLPAVATGLQHVAENHRAVACFVCTCDAPALTPQVATALVEHLADADAVGVRIDGRPVPLPTAIAVRTWPVVRALVESGERRLMALFAHVATRWIDAELLRGVDPDLQSLASANTPDEYADLVRRFGGAS